MRTLQDLIDEGGRWWERVKRDPPDPIGEARQLVAMATDFGGRMMREAPARYRTLRDLLLQIASVPARSQQGYAQTMRQAPQSLEAIRDIKDGRLPQ